VYSSLSASNPGLPKIMIGPGDRNWTYVGKAIQYGYNNTVGLATSVTIRVETNSSYSVNTTRGSADSVYEFTFINIENCVDGYNFLGFGLNTGVWANSTAGAISGVYNASSGLLVYGNLSAYTAYAPYVYEPGNVVGNWGSSGSWQVGQWWYPWPNTNF
jgi:hypothetical protein